MAGQHVLLSVALGSTKYFMSTLAANTVFRRPLWLAKSEFRSHSGWATQFRKLQWLATQYVRMTGNMLLFVVVCLFVVFLFIFFSTLENPLGSNIAFSKPSWLSTDFRRPPGLNMFFFQAFQN